MSDTAGALAAMQEAAGAAPAEPVEAAAPVEQAAPAPIEPAPAVDEQFSVMPLWKDKLEQLPEAMRADYAAIIRDTEKNANDAIRKAREASVPADYRSLYEEAKEAGLTADQIRDGYNNALDLQQALLEDPYGTLKTLEASIDAAVRAGDLTIAEGKAAKKDIAEAVGDQLEQTPLETETDREVRELKAWQQQQIQRDQQREYQQQVQAIEQDAQQFISDAEKAFVDAGLVNDKGEHITSVETRRSVFTVAGALKDQNPDLPTADAVAQAVQSLGGWDLFRPTRAPGIPVGGTSTAAPVTTAAPGTDDAAQRKQEALALLRHMSAPS